MAVCRPYVFAIWLATVFAQPPELSSPFPLPDTTDYTKVYSNGETAAALGSTPSYWDGEIQQVNGVNVVSTVKSTASLPDALDNAVFTVEFMTNALAASVLSALQDHNVYIYHCDPLMQTGIGLQAKQGQYDYVSDLINYNQDTHDGRAVDQVYGYGGSRSSPTSTCDCNVIPEQCSNNAYSSSSILVHEFGHTIMDVGVRYGFASLYSEITGSIYSSYRQVSGATSSYCGDTANEMWACGVETWLSTSLRTDVNPGIYTIDLMYQNLPSLYNALYQVFGQPPKHLIPSLSSVSSLTSNQWTFFDYYLNKFADSTLQSQWNSIRYIGSPSGSSSTTTTTTTSTTTTTTSSGSSSSSISCGESVNGVLSAGETKYFSFTYQGGDVLMWPCGSTTFANRLRIIDYYWNEKGSDTVSSYYDYGCSSSDSTVWADSSSFNDGATYWVVLQGKEGYESGTYGITMYCYGAAEETAELDMVSLSGCDEKTSPLWVIVVAVVLISVVVDAVIVYVLVKYFTKRKMAELQRKQERVADDEEELEVDMAMNQTAR